MDEKNTKSPLVLFQHFGSLPHSRVAEKNDNFRVVDPPMVKARRSDGMLKRSWINKKSK